ncbi:MAG: TerB N-terminal domain-containing protein [Clostridia bacterium]|nr:TerB N-terminal domain-containing protein [Clostridia bacterium]
MSVDEKDAFWDISKLVPKKKSTAAPFSTKGKLSDVSIPGDAESSPPERNRLTAVGGNATAEERVYTRTEGLIKRVIIRRTPDKYDYYASFVKAATLYYDFKAPECEFAPYYSYMPQYIQLTQPQKSYYFYWRSMVRKKKYIKTDYSYFYLYVYEIINLPELIPPERGVEMLIDLWCAYRKQLPNIDANMSLWIQDYCLVYGIDCPMDRIRDFIFTAIGSSGFKEFFLSDAEILGQEGVLSVVSYLSDYDWRSGKYAGGDSREAYAKHLTGAMTLIISRLLHGGKILKENSETARLERFAFRSMLTTSAIKYRITVEYRPICEESELRGTVTAALKYTENKLRALMGVKSRLAVKELPQEYRELIDGYFNELFDKVNRERARAARPEYEKLYEAESNGISTTDADEIERSSWLTTARLVEDVEEYAPDTSEEPEEKADSTAQPEVAVDTYGLSGSRIEFVRAALTADTAKMAEIAASTGELADSLADEINEAFADGFGDVILEPADEGYTVIDDYREDIEKWLLKIMK